MLVCAGTGTDPKGTTGMHVPQPKASCPDAHHSWSVHGYEPINTVDQYMMVLVR